MRALFLDDREERHALFQRKWGFEYATTHVYCYEDAVDALNNDRDFDIMFLDHDLVKADDYCNPEEATSKTGSDFVKDIIAAYEEQPQRRRPGNIIVHSINIVGNKNMCTLLEDAGFAVMSKPFYDLV